MDRRLSDHQKSQFSQSGEEGIIDRVFEVVGEGNKFCCEFGAWDGIVLSNTRSLILQGWSALFIEGDPDKFRELQSNYAERPNVVAECSFVDGGDNSLAHILQRKGLTARLDLLSIDVDGLDFNIFSTLDRLPSLPRLVVIEVQPEHGFAGTDLLPDHIARENVGQPLAAFVRRGEQMGYRLVCYHGANAYFLAEDAGGHTEIPTLSAERAWKAIWPSSFSADVARYFFLRNNGLADTSYKFNNPLLTREQLGIPPVRAAAIYLRAYWRKLRRSIKRSLRNGLRS